MIATVHGAARLEGEITPPGDKSISHRALILGALASGTSKIAGLSTGADVESTARCLRDLGVEIDGATVAGRGLHGLRHAAHALDCGNSGTTMRLLAGVLAAQEFETELTGDASLQRRPMDRIVDPLKRMGAYAVWPPLRVGGRRALRGIEYHMPVASAQVKSALLLAGLYARGATTVVEPVRTRDHTELMLEAMGADVAVTRTRVKVRPAARLEPLDIVVPVDFSAAAFWIVAAALIEGSRIKLHDVGVNPTRTALLGVLAESGVEVGRSVVRQVAHEAVADLEVAFARPSRGVEVDAARAAEMIDELPALAVAATQMPGTTVIRGAAELRVKESDRIEAMARGLSAMGADIEAHEDGWTIRGPRRLEGARVDSAGDHRVAMALAVAGLLAAGTTEIEGAECVAISYPRFWDHVELLSGVAAARSRSADC